MNVLGGDVRRVLFHEDGVCGYIRVCKKVA